jgi:Bacterial type II and III secretion system protein
MRRLLVTTVGVLLGVGVAARAARAAGGDEAGASSPGVARLQVTIERYLGERKTGSAPYTILTTTDGKQAKLRMGVEVPIAVSSGASTDGKSTMSFQYRSVGTNFDCDVTEKGDLYEVRLKIENSSVYTPASSRDAELEHSGIATDKPLFRTFSVTLDVAMRDGQTLQTVASTDPVTGEVVKVDLALKIVK